MRRLGGAFIISISLGSVAFAAQPSLLPGRYHVGEMGVLTLDVSSFGSRTQVKGHYARGARCDFTPADQLLDAELEGSALIGKLTTCMEGCASPTGVIPFVGVVNDGVVTAFISLPKGCSAPGIDERMLRIGPTLESLKELANEAATKGEWATAQLLLRRATETAEGKDDPRVLGLLGGAYNSGRQYGDGRQVLLRAMQLAPGRITGDEKAELLYNLACSEANLGSKDGATRAIDYLRQALQVGKKTTLLPVMSGDPDLDPLRELPDFQKLIGKKAGR